MADPTPAVEAAIEAELRLLDPEVRRSPQLFGELSVHQHPPTGGRRLRLPPVGDGPAGNPKDPLVVTINLVTQNDGEFLQMGTSWVRPASLAPPRPSRRARRTGPLFVDPDGHEQPPLLAVRR